MNSTPIQTDSYYDLTKFITEETNTFIRFRLPSYLYLELDRDWLLTQYRDVELNLYSHNEYKEITCFKK